MLKKSGSCTGLSLEFGGIYSLKLSEVCGSGSSLLRIDRSQLVPGPKSNWSYSVMVITLDFESSDPGSNPGRTFFCLVFQLCVCDRQLDYAHRKSINQNKFRSRRLN